MLLAWIYPVAETSALAIFLTSDSVHGSCLDKMYSLSSPPPMYSVNMMISLL